MHNVFSCVKLLMLCVSSSCQWFVWVLFPLWQCNTWAHCSDVSTRSSFCTQSPVTWSQHSVTGPSHVHLWWCVYKQTSRTPPSTQPNNWHTHTHTFTITAGGVYFLHGLHSHDGVRVLVQSKTSLGVLIFHAIKTAVFQHSTPKHLFVKYVRIFYTYDPSANTTVTTEFIPTSNKTTIPMNTWLQLPSLCSIIKSLQS